MTDLVFQGLSKQFGSVWTNRDISLPVQPGTMALRYRSEENPS